MTEITKVFNDSSYVATYSVNRPSDGMRLDSFIQEHMPTLSRQYIKKRIDRGDIVISGRTNKLKPSCKVHTGEVITVTTNRFHSGDDMETEYWRGQQVELSEELEVVEQTPHLLVINKPALMSTHPAGRHLFYCATVLAEKKLNVPVQSIHRLDRETSGVLMLGLDSKMAAEMAKEFEERRVQKFYFFIAHDKAPAGAPDQFTAKERMGSAGENEERVFVESYPENSLLGKSAETDFHILRHFRDDRHNPFVVGLALPHTGRQHQIRVHAAVHGYPLLGDKLYNGDRTVFERIKDGCPLESDFDLLQIPSHALHATGLLVKGKFYFAPIPKLLSGWLEGHHVAIKPLENEVRELIQSYCESPRQKHF